MTDGAFLGEHQVKVDGPDDNGWTEASCFIASQVGKVQSTLLLPPQYL